MVFLFSWPISYAWVTSVRNVKYKNTDALSLWHQQSSTTVDIHVPLQTRGETRCPGVIMLILQYLRVVLFSWPISYAWVPIRRNGYVDTCITVLMFATLSDFTQIVQHVKTYWFHVVVCIIIVHFLYFLFDSPSLVKKRKRSDSDLWQKPLHPQKNPKSNVTTQNATKTSITQRLRTDLRRSVEKKIMVILDCLHVLIHVSINLIQFYISARLTDRSCWFMSFTFIPCRVTMVRKIWLHRYQHINLSKYATFIKLMLHVGWSPIQVLTALDLARLLSDIWRNIQIARKTSSLANVLFSLTCHIIPSTGKVVPEA